MKRKKEEILKQEKEMLKNDNDFHLSISPLEEEDLSAHKSSKGSKISTAIAFFLVSISHTAICFIPQIFHARHIFPF